MNARLTTIVVAMSVIALIAAGCGGDDDSGSGADAESNRQAVTTSSLSKAAFIKKASAACEREGRGTLEKMLAYMRRHRSKGLPERVLMANMVRAVFVPMAEAQIAAIRELGAPAGDEEKIEAILADQQAAVDEVKQLDEVKSIKVVESYFNEVSDEFRDYGFLACIFSLNF